MRRVIRFKNLQILDLLYDFVLSKQYNISAKQVHSVDGSNQETIMMEDIYAITDSLQTLSLPEPKKKAPASSLEVTPKELH